MLKEQEERIEENRGLVRCWAGRLAKKGTNEYDELVSLGNLGLVQAALTFDISKEVQFSTYATKCIRNEMLMHYRREKKHANNVSLEDVVTYDGYKDNEIRYEDIIASKEPNIVEQLIDKEKFIKLINIVLNCIVENQRLVLLYKIAGMRQEDIGKKLGITQSTVSRTLKEAINTIENVICNQEEYEKIFFLDIYQNSYLISIMHDNIDSYMENTLKRLSLESRDGYKVINLEDQIQFQVPAHLESFSIVAKIIEQLPEKKPTIDYDKYFYGLNMFTVEMLRFRFLDWPDKEIHRIIKCARDQGIIERIGLGKYKVNR